MITFCDNLGHIQLTTLLDKTLQKFNRGNSSQQLGCSDLKDFNIVEYHNLRQVSCRWEKVDECPQNNIANYINM